MSTKNSTKANLRLCGCGCGTVVKSRKSLYAPGHDARHAGLVAREVVATGDMSLIKSALPSVALRDKATAMATRLAEKPVKSSSAKASTVVESVKVGRWTYPARKVNGKVERNTKRDGSGEWVAV